MACRDGETLTGVLRSAGVNTDFITADEGVSGHAIIQVDSSGQNCIIINGGANDRIRESFVSEVLDHFGDGDILLLQNDICSIPSIMKKAYSRGMSIAFNPSPLNEQIAACPLETVRWFILNQVEGEGLTGETKAESIAEKLLKRFPGCAVVLTLGHNGVLYRDSSGISYRHGIYRVKRVDTTGAGDTFTGYFLACVAAGLDAPEILRRASVASSLAVSRMGAAASIPTLREVLAAKLEPVQISSDF